VPAEIHHHPADFFHQLCSDSRGHVGNVASRVVSSLEAFKAGVISNLTNSKTIAYFTSIFAATGAASLPRSDQILAAILLPTISSIWYGSLVVFASQGAVRQFVEEFKQWFDRIAGVVMIGFGTRVLSTLWRQWAKGT
jgi:threonine efflux protein